MSGIKIRCFRKTKNREAEPITESLITSESVAAARGKRFLDDPEQGAYYQVIRRSLRVPHKSENVTPGSWILVTDQKLGLKKTPLKVLNYKIEIKRDGVWATMDTEEYRERTGYFLTARGVTINVTYKHPATAPVEKWLIFQDSEVYVGTANPFKYKLPALGVSARVRIKGTFYIDYYTGNVEIEQTSGQIILAETNNIYFEFY